MADNNRNTRSATIIAGISAFAVAAWAFYAWKTDSTPPTESPATVLAAKPAEPHTNNPPPGEAPPDSTGETVVDDTEGIVPVATAVGVNQPVRAEDGDSAMMMAGGPPDRRVNPPEDPGASGQRSIDAELETGRSALQSGDMLTARTSLSRALNLPLPSAEHESIRKELSRVSDALLFSRSITPDDPLTQAHVVKPGESLNALATQRKVPQELLQRINGIANPHLLQADTRIKLFNGPFDAVIYKSSHRLDVYQGKLYIRSFKVGLGAHDGTPLGRWVVGNKHADPDWKDPATGRYYPPADPENPIGERWISLECVEGDCLGRSGFGIHGTLDPESIGANESMGCVRLLPEDVALVFDLLIPRESFVEIRP